MRLAVLLLAPLLHLPSPVPQSGRPPVEQKAERRTDTPHIVVTTSMSVQAAAPGATLTLIVDVVPKPGMHVYAPGQSEYIPVSVTLEPDAAIKTRPPRFPPPELFFFEPLQETQRVYSRSFRIRQDVTVAATAAVRERAAAGRGLTVRGVLKYQACDDTICYVPVDVPVSWTVPLRPVPR